MDEISTISHSQTGQGQGNQAGASPGSTASSVLSALEEQRSVSLARCPRNKAFYYI